MRVDLAFGKAGPAELPGGFRYRVLEARSAAPVADANAAIEQALDHPAGGSPLKELAEGKRSAAISVCDITRPAPNRLTLPPILARLERAGIARDRITILIATGLHRAATAAEILEIVGADITPKYRVVNHNARAIEEHRALGQTASGTPVYIDERFVSADLHLTLGFIEPHLMLGFSGGRKLVAPGLAAQETIKVLHSPRFMRAPNTFEGSIEKNPLHQELLEIARMARHDFICDVALARDRRITGVFAGDPVLAHRQGVEFVSRALLETLDEPVHAVITTGAGYPLDMTFYQAIKGVTAAAHIVRPGGRILVVAACEEGAGADEFSKMLMELSTYEQFLRGILEAPVIVDQWQLEKLSLVGTHLEVLFYVPGLPDQYRAALGRRAFGTLPEAIRALTEGLPEQASIAVIPDGPYVLARVDKELVGA